MQTTILLNTETKSDVKILLDIAKKIKIKTKVLSLSEIEEIGLGYAINKGKTNEYIDTQEFVNLLRK